MEQQIARCGSPLDLSSSGHVGDVITCRLTSKIPLRNESGDRRRLDRRVARYHRAQTLQEDFRRGQAQLLEMIARNEPLEMILEALVLMVEAEIDGIHGAILLLDQRWPPAPSRRGAQSARRLQPDHRWRGDRPECRLLRYGGLARRARDRR
jgi:hypothetical protein